MKDIILHAMTTMTATTREALLSQWIKPSSADEKTRQDRAERMVREAVDAHPIFKGVDKRIYTKGSYPNNTNVRFASDVDVVVELHECSYYDYAAGITPPASSPGGGYEGIWTPAFWRAEVNKALVTAFTSTSVDTSGKIATAISEVPGSRPSADVVPSFLYYRYDAADRSVRKQGSCVFPSNGGTKVVNWPDQQLTNGRTKNTNTGQRYKNYVRALKNAEDTLAAAGTMSDLPSYLMECLVYNVPDATLKTGTLDKGFQETLRWLYLRLDDGSAYEDWVEPNWCKWLFKGVQKWTVDDAKTLVLKTWNHLGYAN